MPDGAVIIAAITSCTNTSNPRNVIAAGLLARNANARGPACASRGSSPRWRRAPRPCSCTWKKPACCPSWSSWASASSPSPAPPATACRGALDPAIQQEIIERDLYATAVLSGNRNFDGRIHPYAKQAFLASPPLVVAYAIAGTIRFDIEKDVLGVDAERPAGHAEGHLAERRGDRRHRREPASSPSSSARSTTRCSRSRVDERRARSARCTTGARRAPTSAVRRTGKARWPASARCAACARWRCCRDNITTDHLSPSNAILLDSAAGEYLHEDGPAGRGLQLLRHPPRRPPDGAARHLRQPDSWSTRWRWSTAR